MFITKEFDFWTDLILRRVKVVEVIKKYNRYLLYGLWIYGQIVYKVVIESHIGPVEVNLDTNSM